MSNWVVNASAAIPFSGGVGSAPYPYGYYGDQAAHSQHGQAVASPEGFPGRGLSGVPGSAPPQPMVAASWNYQPPAANMRAWSNQQVLPAGVISGQAPDQASVQITPKHGPQTEKIADLERDLLAARSQLEQQQQEGRILLAQVESLTAELAAERQRSDELGRQVLTMSAAHQALQLEHERLTSQHSAVVREHEHMTSSQAVTLRELEARHADVSRLQRQLGEAQAAVAAATAAADAAAGGGQQAGAAAQHGGKHGGQRASAPPPPPLARLGGRAGSHLAAADEDRWALRLHKAERALEEERRVSEDLRQRLKAADVESRAMFKKLHKLESELESPSGGAMPIANSDPLPRSPRTLSTLSTPPPLVTTSSGALASLGSGQLPGMGSGPASFAAGPALGRAASAGSGGGGTSVTPGVVKAGTPPGSGGGTPQLAHPTEEQVARLKREVDGLRSDLTRLAAAEEVHRVAARAAEDRARAAELVSLDVRRQCDQAARTIGHLIDENSELVAKVNAQANALSECKSAAASKETALRNLEVRLAQAQAQLSAAQTQARDLPPRPPGEHPQHSQQQPQPQHHQLSNGPAPSASTTAPHGSVSSLQPLTQLPGPWRPGGAAPGREVLLPGGPLTEADWKLVMLSEEVRRLVEEVSLSTTACLALQLKLGQGGQQQQQQDQVQPLDLPHILSRLEGLAGRRLGPGETAAYIIELAGHMEALEQVLTAQRRRMAALRGEQAGAEAAGTGVGAAGGAGPRDGGSSGPSLAGALQESARWRQGEQQQQRLAEQARGDSRTQDAESRGEERWLQAQGQAEVEGAAGAGFLQVQDAMATAAEGEFADGADSSEALFRQMAFGSFVESVTSQQQQLLPPPSASPQSPAPAPPPSSHHIVSPFNHLAQRKDSQQQQEGQGVQQGGQPGVGSSGYVAAANPSAADAGSQGLSLELHSAQRPELAAVAAEAVAAAAEAEADRSPGTDVAAPAIPLSAGVGGVEGVPVALPQLEAPPSPRAAPSTAALTSVAVGVPAQLVGVVLNNVDPLFDDDLLDEVAAGRVKPRRPRVGLWGWISGEAAR